MPDDDLDANDPAWLPPAAPAGADGSRNAAAPAGRPLYYLDHFRFALDWIGARYHDLLAADERDFLMRFPALPEPSQALLVRMAMRRGALFRASKLDYPEIGDIAAAARPLVAAGWVDDRPLLSAHELCGLLRKPELATIAALPAWSGRKADLMALMRHAVMAPRRFEQWVPAATECVYRLAVGDLCDRLRLIFFGNLHQEWSEFVVTELGLLQYEKVAFSLASRGFRERGEIDAYLQLHRHGERFDDGVANGPAEALDALVEQIEAVAVASEWIEARRARLLLRIGRHHERQQDFARALAVYQRSRHPEAALRAVRVLEKTGRPDAAWVLAGDIAGAVDEAGRQQLARIVPRLQRKLGVPATPPLRPAPLPRHTLIAPRPSDGRCVELLVRDHLHAPDAPAYYVENSLINSLFGLLCWRAIFSAIPGAFFHPFQSGPADLHAADFLARRRAAFAACFAQLESDCYRQTIMAHYREKKGIRSPFVVWEALSDDLLADALACLPPAHLRHWFERMVRDIACNCSGIPDLIQFWPAQQRYRMVEVKGPGDRLQDSQARFLDDCRRHAMPVEIWHVQWAQADAAMAANDHPGPLSWD